MPSDISLSLKAQLALERAGFRFTHALGQNFIFDEELLTEIARCARADAGANVLEIGPGAGMLTAVMAMRGANVLSVELDRTLEAVLSSVVGELPNVSIVYADALKADLNAILKERFGDEEYIICANLPYYITADFILKAVALKPMPKRLTFMVQKEAASRILSECGDEQWCALGAIVGFYCEGEVLMDVPRSAFTPEPHVDSALIQLRPRPQRLVPHEDTEAFVRFIKAAFALRRKTLSNCLSAAYSIPKTQIALKLEELGYDPRIRGEALPLDELSRVFQALQGDL
ncbi:MAG: ribosomal RNA small subunit methyltransferase A [Clostridia bacterium]|nr:ribosomal RNA small subunit methyltransferase A [Clostridia bacterium]